MQEKEIISITLKEKFALAFRGLMLCLGILETEMKQAMETFKKCIHWNIIYRLKGKLVKCSCWQQEQASSKALSYCEADRQRTGCLIGGISVNLKSLPGLRGDLICHAAVNGVSEVCLAPGYPTLPEVTLIIFSSLSQIDTAEFATWFYTVFRRCSNSSDIILHLMCSFEQNTHL